MRELIKFQKDYPEKLKIQRKEQLKSFKKKLPKELKTSIGQGYLIKFKELRDFAKEPQIINVCIKGKRHGIVFIK